MMQGCTIGLLPPGVLPFFAQMMQQQATPTSSADEADLQRSKPLIKSPLGKQDQVSTALPSDSCDEGDSIAAGHAGCIVVESRPTATAAAAAAAALPLPVAALAGGAARGRSQGPEPWLTGLFTSSLFEPHGCRCHPGTVKNGAVKRNENNQYCLDCTHAHGAGMCKLCLPAHSASCSGRVFQIRKYMYQTCVHVDDIQPLYDVSGVQAYCINSRRAVLIHPKNVEKEQKCPAFDHNCLGCQKPLRHDCTYCSLRCKVDVEFGFAPITPKGSLTARNGAGAAGGNGGELGGSLAVPGGGGGASVAAAAAAAVMLTAPPSARQQGGSRLAAAGIKRPPPYAGTMAAAAVLAAAPVAELTLDVSHATRCSSGCEAGSSRSKRRKGERPARSHVS